MCSVPLFRPAFAAFLTVVVSTSAMGATPAYAAAPTMTLSSSSGPSGGGNTIAASVGGSLLVFPSDTTPVVQFQYYASNATTCRATAQAIAAIAGTSASLTDGVLTVDPSDVRRISNTKVAFTVPTGLELLDGQTSSKWNVCVYNSDSITTSTLLAKSTYTLALRPKITAILPARSPASGGQTITVNGTGFGSGTTATIDDSPVTNVILAATGDSFSATTPAHSIGTGWLVVKTAGGSVNSFDPDNDGQPEDNDDGTPDAPIPFTFDNSITISPNSAAAGSSTYIDISGTGFGVLTFDQSGSAAPTDPTAHVFLVRDSYDSTSNRGVQECLEVLVLDDTEIVCRLDLAADSLDPITSAPVSNVPVALGTYTITVVADGSIGAVVDETTVTMLTSGATFTVAPY